MRTIKRGVSMQGKDQKVLKLFIFDLGLVGSKAPFL